MISDAQQKTYESRPSRSTTEKPNYYLSRPARGLKISLPARDSELSTKIGLEEKRKTSEVPGRGRVGEKLKGQKPIPVLAYSSLLSLLRSSILGVSQRYC